VSATWASHGHYIVEGDDVRVIELKNILPSRMYVARLLPGGKLSRGTRLDGYYTSPPWRAADGAWYFFRAGALFSVQGLSADRRVTIAAERDAFGTGIVGRGNTLYLPYGVAGRAVRRSLGSTCEPPFLIRTANTALIPLP
jgi:hypothetical protein